MYAKLRISVNSLGIVQTKKGLRQRLGLFPLYVLLAVVLISPESQAGDSQESICSLDRSPFLLPIKDPFSQELQCEYDQDGNGLDDEMEDRMYDCFAPLFKFDIDEDKLEADEPVVFARTERIRVHDIPKYSNLGFDENSYALHMEFRSFMREDSGFTEDWEPACYGDMQDHIGDIMVIDVSIRIQHQANSSYDGKWYAIAVHVKDGPGYEPDDYFRGISPHATWDGTRVVVYPSAGKHHNYFAPGEYKYDISGWASDCYDPARGNGAVRQSIPHRAPILNCDLPFELNALLRPDGYFRNVCAKMKFDSDRIATRIIHNDLGYVGFPGETYCKTDFLGNEDVRVWSTFQPDDDIDGDTRSEIYRIHGGRYAVDPCPLGDEDFHDSDDDGIDDGCDPYPNFRSRYVAGGSTDFPQHAGFVDFDGDKIIEGADNCPYRATSPSNTRAGVQYKYWQPGAEIGGFFNHDNGIFQRGDNCDPYPRPGSINWKSVVDPEEYKRPDHCQLPGMRVSGSDFEIIYQDHPQVGISENDPDLQYKLANTHSVEETVAAQTYRCACRNGFEGEACINNPASPCYGGPALAIDHGPGQGWIPVDRVNCSVRDADSYCVPYHVTARYDRDFLDDSANLAWYWRRELAFDNGESYKGEAPPANWQPHFAPGDFVVEPSSGLACPGPFCGTPKVSSVYGYVLWTIIGANQHIYLGDYIPPGPKSCEYHPDNGQLPDPECFDINMANGNDSTGSRLMRSVYTPDELKLVGAHEHIDNTFFCAEMDLKYLIHVHWGEELIRWPEYSTQPAEQMLFGRHGLLFEETVGLTSDQRIFTRHQLGEQALDSELGKALKSSTSSTAPLGFDAQGRLQMLWVQTGALQAEWAVLRSTNSVDRDGVQILLFDIIDKGSLAAAVHQDAQLLLDGSKNSVAVLVTGGQVFDFNAERGAKEAWRSWKHDLAKSGVSANTPLAFMNGSVYGLVNGTNGYATLQQFAADGGHTVSKRIAVSAQPGSQLAEGFDGKSLLFFEGQGREDLQTNLWRFFLGKGASVIETKLELSAKCDTKTAGQTPIIDDLANALTLLFSKLSDKEMFTLEQHTLTSQGWTTSVSTAERR